MPDTAAKSAAEIIRAEIASCGPISFERFMELALYTPAVGYYTRRQDPFGKRGDFYTAEQVQPVFGILVAQCAARMRDALGAPDDFRLIELGAGRGDMAAAFSDFNYLPIDINRGELPDRFTGMIFANEFFDALPVHVIARRGGEFRERFVDDRNGRLAFVDGPPPGDRLRAYLDAYHRSVDDGSLIEVNLRALDWMDRISARADNACLLAIDYGYTTAELVRFPHGTLMSYRRHTATDDVLADPGERDITAHVAFTPLEDAAVRNGWKRERFESLARFLLDIGEKDQFEEALHARTPAETLARRLQLKTLLFGMGETFRVLLLRNYAQK